MLYAQLYSHILKYPVIRSIDYELLGFSGLCENNIYVSNIWNLKANIK